MSDTAHQRLIGESPALSELLDHASRAAALNRPILVVGERGTGKEMIAQRLHFLSPRWQNAFLKVNCGALSDTLLDADLFGYEPGAFTGANRLHKGRFERAHEGTLFLDEIGNMSAQVQEKLLRVIEYGEFERLGGQSPLQVDVRIVAATHENLPELVAQGRFRADLLDRLSFDVLSVPPLRQRQGDIPVLAEHFAIAMSSELGWDWFPGFAGPAMHRLEQHPFYGNVRELKNVVERSVYRWAKPDKPIADVILDPFDTPWSQTHRAKQEALPLQFHDVIARREVALLQQALDANGHHQGHAAESLGLSYHQLRNLLRKHGMLKRSKPSHTD
ncbi:MAG: sigma 54-interacting transcriptional regulator [Saccharospirillum sp.]